LIIKELNKKSIELRRVWIYQRGNQNPYVEEEQTTQWPKEKVQKDKQQSTKHTHKTTDRVTRTPLEAGGELRKSISSDVTDDAIENDKNDACFSNFQTNWQLFFVILQDKHNIRTLSLNRQLIYTRYKTG
jgi:hypothetical protein